MLNYISRMKAINKIQTISMQWARDETQSSWHTQMECKITQFGQDKGITKCSQNTQQHTICFVHSGSSTRITSY
jgi:hypothetical protein